MNLRSCFAECVRRGESGASLAAKRFEQQRQQQLQQQVPLRQLDDCSCYVAKTMTLPTTTTLPVYDCPCAGSDTDNTGRIPPPPPPLLHPVTPPLLYPLSDATPTCDVCGRALSAAFTGDESLCSCAPAAFWQSPYSRLPTTALSDTGNHVTYETGSHVTYVSTTATAGSCRRAASLRPTDAALDDVRHVTVTSDVSSCTLTSTRGRDRETGRRVVSD